MENVEKMKVELSEILEHGNFDRAWIYDRLTNLCNLACMQPKKEILINTNHSPINGC